MPGSSPTRSCASAVHRRHMAGQTGLTSEVDLGAPRALMATLGLAATCWVVAVRQMERMDMGVATELGSLAFFVATWVPMMAAMMLPGAAPAVASRARSHRPVLAVPLFLGSYLAVWTLVGLAVYALDRPHGSAGAGALTIAAGVYELTPVKRECRRRCRESPGSGLRFGLFCVGSSIGLMAMLVAVGVMSVTWMAIVGVVILAQKLAPPVAAVDVPPALAIVGLGALSVVAPDAVPGLMAPM
jgi:predicted metal-binding membrane protein